MAGISRFNVITERSLNKLRLKGFSGLELDNFQMYHGKAEMILNPFHAAVEKIKGDRNLSPEGKATRLQDLKAETAGKLNGLIAADFDKSIMIANLKQLATGKVSKIRASNQPANETLAYLQQAEARSYYVAQHEKHLQQSQAVGATNEQKLDVDGPLVGAVIDAAAKYIAQPKGPAHEAQNKKSELILSAIMAAPYPLISADLQQRIETHLQANLAMPEIEQLRVVEGYHQALIGFGADLKTLINEA